MDNIIFTLTLLLIGLLLIPLSYKTKNKDILLPAIAMGPKGIRIPKLLLHKLNLIDYSEIKTKIIFNEKNITLIALCIAGVLNELLDLGFGEGIIKYLARFIEFAIAIIGFLEIFLGYKIIKSSFKKDSDYEIVEIILNFLTQAKIDILSWKDFANNFKYFAHLLPIIENEDNVEYEDLIINLSNITNSKNIRDKAMKDIQEYVIQHGGMMPSLPVPKKKR